VIAAPAGSLSSPGVSTSIPLAAQFQVINSGGPVNISGITFDGTGLVFTPTSSFFLVTSILYESSPGTVNHIVLQNLQPSGFPAAGIMVLDDSAVSPTVTIQNSLVSLHAQETSDGILAVGAGELNVTNNYLSVSSAVDGGAGIFVDGGGVTAAISGNTIDLGGDESSGILSVSAGPQTITGNAIAVSSIAVGIEMLSANATVKGNQIYSESPGTGFGINLSCSLPAALSGNLIMGTSVALTNVPAGISLQKSAGTFFDVPTIEQLCQ
jgi:hypothetical protein